jgi:hypothetical protein
MVSGCAKRNARSVRKTGRIFISRISGVFPLPAQDSADEMAEKGKHHPWHLWLGSDRYHSSESHDTYEWF